MIAKEEGHSVEEVELVWSGKKLEDTRTLADSNLQDSTTVQLVVHVQEQEPEEESQDGWVCLPLSVILNHKIKRQI